MMDRARTSAPNLKSDRPVALAEAAILKRPDGCREHVRLQGSRHVEARAAQIEQHASREHVREGNLAVGFIRRAVLALPGILL